MSIERVVESAPREGRVVRVLNANELVINLGADDGITTKTRFLVFRREDEEITDPVTNQSLGRLEVVKGTARVKHLQDKLCTVRSDRHETRKVPIFSVFGSLSRAPSKGDFEEETYTVPFENAQVGDAVRVIS